MTIGGAARVFASGLEYFLSGIISGGLEYYRSQKYAGDDRTNGVIGDPVPPAL
jgi:hypothetical protein